MSARLVRVLLRLYPRWWRDRYEIEISTLLGDHGLTPACALDLALGAVDARIGGDPSADRDTRARAALAASLWTLAALIPLVGGLSRLADAQDVPRALAIADHQFAVTAPLALTVIGFLAAGVACFCAGLLVLPTAISAAWRTRDRRLVIPLALIAASLIMLVAGFVVLSVATSGLTYAQRNGPGPIEVVKAAVICTWMAAVAVGMAGASRLVRRAPLDDVRTTTAIAVLLAGGTSVGIVGALCWVAAVILQAPGAFDMATTVGFLAAISLGGFPQLRALIVLSRCRRAPEGPVPASLTYARVERPARSRPAS